MPLRERWRWPAASFLIAVFGVAGAANAGVASPDKTPPACRPEASNLKANPRAGTDSGSGSCGDSDRDANSNAEPTPIPLSDNGVESSPRSGEDTDSAQPLPLEPPESPQGKMSGVSSGFSIARLKHGFFSDQKAIWTSPLHLASEDNSRLAAWGIGTLLLVAADKPIMRHLESTPMAHSSSLSTFGIAALVGGGAAFYLLGSATDDPHSRETGFLAGETAVDSIVVAEAMKFTFQRPRPNAVNAGRFGAGGASFPSEHALAAWSMASVLAQEYPGPLTKLLVYGAASGISDVLDILKAIATGSIAFLLLLRYGMGVKAFPLSVYALEALLSFTLLSGIRIFSRMLVETVRRDSASKRLLLVGAGRAAQMIIRETQELESGYQVIGCVDDNPLKAGLRVLGVPVFGPVADLVEVVAEQRIDEVLIAIPSATPNEMRRVVALCKQSTATFRTVPALAELIAGRVTLQQVREVSLSDLLGRIPIDLDLEAVREHIRDRVVMVTGAAGSIGSELCRQIGTYQPKLLICLDQNETGIFHLQHRLTQGEIDERKIFCVADFCNPERMRKVFAAHGVEIVFHAAAYKHVPVMESNVEEAVINNVFGLLALLNVAEHSKCSTFVMISSDKAVNPTNVMGCTKRLGELILAAWPGDRLRCVSVRFGNVLGSNGSVIPLFQEQIRQNQPITITHPEITRFFMTISEAVSLVLQAFAIGRHRDILVLDMGEPVRVAELAKTLARLSGKTGQEFKIIGLRPGEKLFEELFYADERVFPSPCQKIACTESIKLGWPALKNALDELYVAVSLGERESILAHLQRIVPQFSFEGLKHAPSAERANAMESISLISGSHHGPPATEAVERRLLPYPAWPATTPGHAQRDKRLLGPAAGD